MYLMEQTEHLKADLKKATEENKKECAAKINAILKEYGFQYDLLINYSELTNKIIYSMQTQPRQLILKETT